MAEPERYLLALEIPPDETESFLEALNTFFVLKAPDIKKALHKVEIQDDGQENKRTT